MQSRFWDHRMEALSAARLGTLQEHRLHWQVRRCWDASPWHHARFSQAGIDPASFRGTRDLLRLPVLVDADLPAAPDDDLLTVAPRRWWSRWQPDIAGSRPSRVLTDGDVVQQADIAARLLWAAGARPGQMVTLSPPSGEGTVAAAVVHGLERIAAQPWRASSATGPPMTVSIAGTEPGEEEDGVMSDSDLFWSTANRAASQQMARFVALAAPYVAPTLAYSCGAEGGLHWVEDHFLVEVVHLTKLSPLPAGDVGAVVITDLTREGSPLMRYWTGIQAALVSGPCECGRTSARSPFVRPLQ